jgi:hypothetical protein
MAPDMDINSWMGNFDGNNGPDFLQVLMTGRLFSVLASGIATLALAQAA